MAFVGQTTRGARRHFLVLKNTATLLSRIESPLLYLIYQGDASLLFGTDMIAIDLLRTKKYHNFITGRSNLRQAGLLVRSPVFDTLALIHFF